MYAAKQLELKNVRQRTNAKNVKLHYALLHAMKYTTQKKDIKSNLFDESSQSESEVVSTSDTDE